MMMSADEAFVYWRKALKDIDGETVEMAIDGMRPIIDRAKKAEDEGRITAMQPFIATCNSTKSLAEGWFYMTLRYQPVVDGLPQMPVIKKFTILEPTEVKNDQRPEAEKGSDNQTSFPKAR